MSDAAAFKDKRKYIRFEPEPLDYAKIDLGTSGVKSVSFNPNTVGLIIDEAYGGCSIVMVTTHKVRVGDVYKVQLGGFSPLKDEVKHITPLDSNIVKLGFQFLE